jgi:hypothetical protein
MRQDILKMSGFRDGRAQDSKEQQKGDNRLPAETPQPLELQTHQEGAFLALK